MNESDPADSDENLLLSLCSGDETRIAAAIEQIHVRYLRPLFCAVRRYHAAEDDVHDVLGGVFFELWQSARNGRIKQDISLSAWLFTVARARAIDLARKQISAKLRDEAFHSNTAENTAAAAESAELCQELQHWAEKTLEALDERDRLIMGCYFELMDLPTTSETAPSREKTAEFASKRAKEQITICNVRDAIGRFRERFAKLLKKAGVNLPPGALRYL